MMRLLAFLGDKVVIISNESTICRFEQKTQETPVRGYYDGLFNYTFARRLLVRARDSVRQIDSKAFPFDTLLGITVDPHGEVYTHILSEGKNLDGYVLTEQIGDFQGMMEGLTNSWFGGDTYTVNALSLLWEQTHILDPDTIFSVLTSTMASSTDLTIAIITKAALLKSIEMVNAGMSLSEVEKMWDIKSYKKPMSIRKYGINDVQEFNSHNLAQLTAYHTLKEKESQ